MDLIKTLQKLEPVFIEAAKLAQKMQPGVEHHNKYATGDVVVDIVTAADLRVQEFLLAAMARTVLVNCRLMAEEDTATVKKFNSNGEYYLALDPIDGTANYAAGGHDFSAIVSLHNGRELLYTFIHFPVLNWTHRIINNEYTTVGQAPNFTLPSAAKDTIIYWFGDPEKTIPSLYNELTVKGLKFSEIQKVSRDFGSITMLSCNKVAGIYREDPNVYDSLVELHIAKARGLKIYSGGDFDLSNIKKKVSGFYYPGYYLVLNQLA